MYSKLPSARRSEKRHVNLRCTLKTPLSSFSWVRCPPSRHDAHAYRRHFAHPRTLSSHPHATGAKQPRRPVLEWFVWVELLRVVAVIP
jgi:hypothetical protein